MDDIVVIIIMVLLAVVGGIRQNKKRKDVQAAGKAPKQSVDFWEMLLDQNHGKVTEVETFPEDEPIDVVPKQEPVYRFRPQNEGTSNIMPTPVEEPKKKERTVLIDGEKFSLRKAVIYSEIMNRKYT